MTQTIQRPRIHSQKPATTAQLFTDDITDTILLSVHLLGKPTAEQLYRLHQDRTPNARAMRGILQRLVNEGLLAVIKPIDLNHPSRHLPYIYLDTTASRRHLEQIKGIPFRRPPELPSRDWRFLRHDVTMADELISFELTARKHGIPFGYESHYDEGGKPVFPKVTIHDGDLTHRLRPQPDKTLIIGDTHIIFEHDCGEETIELGNIIRDATIARKHLVYDQLHRIGAFDQLGWGRVITLFIVDGKKGTERSSRKRIARCVETIPETVDPKRIAFIDRPSFVGEGDDVRDLQPIRGDGTRINLPCF